MERSGEMYHLVVAAGGRCQREPDQVGEITEIGFFDGTGLEAKGEGVWVGGDADRGNFQEFLLKEAAAEAPHP